MSMEETKIDCESDSYFHRGEKVLCEKVYERKTAKDLVFCTSQLSFMIKLLCIQFGILTSHEFV